MNRFLIAVLLLIPATNAYCLSPADSLYHAAIALPESLSVREHMNAFRRVLSADPDYAPAHNRLAWLSLELGSPGMRLNARRQIDRALKIDPDNVDYQVTKGAVLWSQHFYGEAVAYYKKILERHLDCADAAYWLGYYHLNAYIDETEQADREHAAYYLERCIADAPDFQDAYYQLGLLHLESGYPDSLILTMQHFLKRYPEDRDGFLFSGLGYIAMGNPGLAVRQFEEAFARMSADERARVEDLSLAATDDQRLRFALADASPRPGATWTDTPAYANFWRSRDPLFLTDYSEARLDHYARFAYANLRFSQPRAHIEGWRTDMGKTYIKFGRYRYRSSTALNEKWYYEGYQISFIKPRVTSGLAGGIFNWQAGYVPKMAKPFMRDPWDSYTLTSREYEKSRAMQRDIPDYIEPSVLEVFKKNPPRSIDPYRKQKYSLPHLIAAFREGDSLRLEIAYAVPMRRIAVPIRRHGLPILQIDHVNDEPVGIIDGVFLFDQKWNATHRYTAAIHLLADARWQTTQADSLRKRYITPQHTVRVQPGQYTVAAEVVDQKSGSIGEFRTSYAPDVSTTGFAMSDLLLASGITPEIPFPENRKDLEIKANPLRTFQRTESVFIYLELYSLQRDAFGRTKYEIAFRISRPRDKEIDPALFTDLDQPEGKIVLHQINEPDEPVAYEVTYEIPRRNLAKDWQEKRRGNPLRKEDPSTTITTEYEGDQTDDFTYLQIDVSRVPIGVHKLTVTARDLHSGKTVERRLLFRVTE